MPDTATPAPTTRDAVERIVYTPSEAASVLGVTRQTVYQLIKGGQLRRFKVGRCARIPVSDVLSLIGGPDAPAA